MSIPLNNYAFIDGQNMHLGTRDAGWIPDYGKFRTYLEEKYSVDQAFYFIGYQKENQDLYDVLKKEGYILIHKPTYVAVDGTVKGNCDAELVLHTMIEYENFNKAVIVSGDGDFYCLIKHLRENRKLRIVLVPNKATMSKLIPIASQNQFTSMNDLMDKIGFLKL